MVLTRDMLTVLYIATMFTIVVSAWQQKKKKKDLVSLSPNFIKLSKTHGFVDKTLFIYHALHDWKSKLVTAPKGFGKTTNLDMLRVFLSIPVGTKEDHIEIHDIFMRLRLYKTDPKFFYKYFGKFPVLHLDFSTRRPIKKHREVVEILKEKVHASFKQHTYFQMNEQLHPMCSIWVNETLYKRLHKDMVLNGIAILSECLYQYFESRKVIMLVDNYDSLVTAASLTADDQELQRVVRTTVKQVFSLVQSNQHVLCMIVAGIFSLDNGEFDAAFLRYRFLENHELGEYFGFLKEEVSCLFKNNVFNLQPDEVKKACTMYEGYTTKRRTMIYRPYSVIKFLKKGKIGMFLKPSIKIDHLMTLYRVSKIEVLIDGLLLEKTVPIRRLCVFTHKEILELRGMFVGHNNRPTIDLLLSYLLDTGYFTYHFKPGTDVDYVKLPNHEAKQCILEYLWDGHLVGLNYSTSDISPSLWLRMFKRPF